MIKVGTLTFHNACNNGAVLQAYALVEFLNELEAVEAEVIDYQCVAINRAYQPEFCFHNCNVLKGLVKYLIRFEGIHLRNRKFLRFSKQYVKKSSCSYTSASISEAEQKYDYLISGSDQIWNYELTDNDTAYLLGFVKDASKKIAYAASLGVSELDEAHSAVYQGLVGSYCQLSVRESNAAAQIEALTGRQVPVHIDPVFLLGREQWEQLAVRPQKENYIWFHMIGMGQIVDESLAFARKLSAETGYPLYFYNSEYIPYLYPAVRHVRPISPDEYLGWILNARFIVSNSFHATCFSIIFEKQFFCEVDFYKGDRLMNLLTLCGLESCALHRGLPDEEQKEHWQADWKQVKKRLAVQIKQSQQYILNAIGSDKK